MNVGKDISLLKLRDQYDAVVFAYGASKDRELGIPGEHLQGLYTARAFVGWYNGLPEYTTLSPDLESGDTAVIIGQGNVALDIARILLSGVDRLRTTDISSRALDVLSRSRINKVHVIGRRGPLQASFTIKELRELIQLPDIQFKPIHEDLLPGPEVELPRAAKRITDLLRKQSSDMIESKAVVGSRIASLDFLQSPVRLNDDSKSDKTLTSITLAQNVYKYQASRFDQTARVNSTNEHHDLETSLVFRSIGYKSEPLPGMEELGINFDMQTGTIPNVAGRAVNGDSELSGLYCAGWVKRGPTGVIASTMEDAFSTAEVIVSDWASKASGTHGWNALKASVPRSTDWQDWLEIDATEKSIGQAKGKEREKIDSIDQMLAIVHKTT